MAGQIAGLVNEIKTCDEIIREILVETKNTLVETGEKLFSLQGGS